MSTALAPEWKVLNPAHPDRPPDRRIRLARALADGRLPALAKPWCDDLVLRATAALRGEGPVDGDVAGALRLHADPGLTAAEIEARVLALQSDEEIAAATGEACDVVATYVGLFFDARVLLWSLDWVAAVVYTPPVDGRFREDQLLRRAGYQSGPTKVDLAVKYFRLGLGAAGDPFNVPELTREEQCRMTVLRLWIAEQTAPNDPSVCQAIDDLLVMAGRLIIEQRMAAVRCAWAAVESGRVTSPGPKRSRATKK